MPIDFLRESFLALLACKDADRRLVFEGLDNTSIQEAIHLFLELFKQVKAKLSNSQAEWQVTTVIQLYDKGILPSGGIGWQDRYREIYNILTLKECGICLDGNTVDYWLEKFNVKPKGND
jgi:hypothetical protein